MKKFFAITLVFIIISFIGCEIIGFLLPLKVDLLSSVENSYKFARGFLFFINCIPSVIITSFLIGFSIVFGKSTVRSSFPFSPGISLLYRNVIISAVISTIAIFFILEIVNPFFHQKMKKYQDDSYFFEQYLSLTQNYYNSGNYEQSYEYAERVLELAPKNTIALNIKKASELYNTENKRRQTPVSEVDSSMYKDPDTTGLTVMQLLQRSKDAAIEKKWLNAHYYAQLALKNANPKQTNYDEAKELAAKAWNNLDKMDSSSNQEQHELYIDKMAGYNALLSGNSLKAYYLFLSLKQGSRKNAVDPDIKRYLTIAENKMKSEYFFTDEILNLQLFKQTKNIYFSIKKNNGETDVFFIKGVINVKTQGGLIQYCFDFTDYTFDSEGNLYRKISVPYAKIEAIPITDIDKLSQISLGLSGKEEYIPYVLLNSVDKEKLGTMYKPLVTYTDLSVKHNTISSLLIAMPYNDLLLAMNSNEGPGNISLKDLSYFAYHAKKYGFSEELFTQNLFYRLLYPFIFLVLLILTAVFSWKLQLEKTVLFKFKWVFFVPFVFVIVYFLYNIILYMISLALFSIIEITGNLTTILLIIFFFIFLFVINSILFLRCRDN